MLNDAIFLDDTTHISESAIFICHKLGAKWYLQSFNLTISSHSNANYIISIYVDISNKVTATKPSQFKNIKVVPEESLNESRGEIRDLFIVNENTHDIVPISHRRSSTAAATPQRPNPSELLSFSNHENNPLP